MNIYKLEIIRKGGWNEYHGFIIVAKKSKEARKIAHGKYSKIFNDYGNERFFDLKTNKFDYSMKNKNNLWILSKYSKITKLGISSKNIKKGVLFSDFWGN